MIKTIKPLKQFNEGLSRMLKLGHDKEIYMEALRLLVENEELPEEYSPHKLKREMSGLWEAHLEDDWLIVWKQSKDKITLVDTGIHSDLFKK